MQTNGQWLRHHRRKALLGLVPLATLLGIDPSHISRVETDQRSPQPEHLQAWAEAIEVDPDEMHYRFGLIPPDLAQPLIQQPELRSDLRQLAKG